MPTLWSHDARLAREAPCIVGVDEAGRGALAGPVVAGAVAVPGRFYRKRAHRAACKGVTDSKQLAAEKREAVFAQLERWAEAGLLTFAWAAADVREIEERNILGATRLAMARALEAVRDRSVQALAFVRNAPEPLFDGEPSGETSAPVVLVDGGPLRPFPYRHRALVKGDSRSVAIALASIVAKVSRDRMMLALDASLPGYGFKAHKGYGTPEHRAALNERGPCAEHRRLFLRSWSRSSEGDDQAELVF